MARKKTTKKAARKTVEAISHEEAKRPNIPTAEYQSIVAKTDKTPIEVAYERRNRDLDPQLVWRGKDEQDQTDLRVQAPPLFIQEKVHPKVLVDDLMRKSLAREEADEVATTLFADHFAEFDGLEDAERKTEFYKHENNWSNRMILGDSLQVMSSLAEREGYRGKVQCIYMDPPYGIKFNSNFQWSTTSKDVKETADHITREPEMVKAFRDTWRDGVHSYLTYLRDRLAAAKTLLTESGSVFIQIGDENVHRVRAVLDEIFGDENFIAQICVRVKSPLKVADLARTTDFLVWYAKDKGNLKFRQPRIPKVESEQLEFSQYLSPFGQIRPRAKGKANEADRLFTAQNLASSGYTKSCMYDYEANGVIFKNPNGKSWKTHADGMRRLDRAGRLQPLKTSLRWRYFFDDAPSRVITDIWDDTFAATDKQYVVQTSESVIQRCILMTTDPGDLVLDPTCGSGTTASTAERWGRRWITIDTSRVALTLARTRIAGSQHPYFLLLDSKKGRAKEAELTRSSVPSDSTFNDVRLGFVCERVPHVTLKSIANNTEVDVIWERFQEKLELIRRRLNAILKKPWHEWEIPPQASKDWPQEAQEFHARWWSLRLERQAEIDASIAAKAEFEYLYDKPYEDKTKVRVAGPFTVESISPHRYLGVGEDDELLDPAEAEGREGADANFVETILETLQASGVQQAHKEDRIDFTALDPYPGQLICAEGSYVEGATGDPEKDAAKPLKRAAIFIGPEFGTVSRVDLVEAAREAADCNFDVLIACAFNFDGHTTELDNLGGLPVLKARMNADLHMAGELKNTGKGNLFVIFGEPDIDILDADDGRVQVKINGVDVFDPTSGEVRSDNADGIACWFIDTDYDQESFFVRHAYFLGANDPYKALKTTLKAEIDEEAWESLHSDTSRPFKKPESGRIAVKVINHLGDEVMKVFRVE